MTKNQITAMLTKFATVPNQAGTKKFIPADKINEIAGEIMKLNKSSFIPPEINEVRQFFVDNGYSALRGEEMFNYYADGNWHDQQGKPVKSWKQKARVVWFKEEYKIVEKSSNAIQNGMVL